MRRAAIVARCEPPSARSAGALRPLHADDLAARVIKALVGAAASTRPGSTTSSSRSATRNGEAPCIGRWAALAPGCRSRCRACSSTGAAAAGCRPSSTAAMMVQTGAADVVLAGGVESMSNVEYYTTACAGARGPAT